MHTFRLGNSRSGKSMILGSSVALFKSTFNNLVDYNSVFCVHTDQTTTLARCTHCSEDSCVINQEHAWIRHEHFEASHSFVHCRVQLFNLPVLEFCGD